jgi:hypothetical protein
MMNQQEEVDNNLTRKNSGNQRYPEEGYTEKRKKIANRLGNKPDDYDLEHKCYGIEDIPLEALNAKKYVKEIINPDILELKKKPWNGFTKSTNGVETSHDLQKILFEVKNGFSDVKLIKLKEPKQYPGVERRDYTYFDWNNSTKLEQKQFMEMYNKV